jgi:hypothetical protein
VYGWQEGCGLEMAVKEGDETLERVFYFLFFDIADEW